MTRGSTNDPLRLEGATLGGKYVLERAVGEGGAAIVYRARAVSTGTPVAVKFLVSFNQVPPRAQNDVLKEFLQEERLVAELSAESPAIVKPHELGVLEQPGGKLPYLVLEWLEGASLDAVLVAETRGGVPPRDLDASMRLLEPIVIALAGAHKRGIAHRDIKPENIFVVGDARASEPTVRLLDFGIAKVMSTRLTGVHQTGTMATAFTPHYGAPEQFSRSFGDTGPWTDVFAMALVVLEVMRGGRRAFSGDDYMDLGRQSCDEQHRPTPKELKLPASPAVEAVFARALAVRPEHRYRDMREFWAALCGAARPAATSWAAPGEAARPPPAPPSADASPTRRSSWWVVLVALLAGAGVAAAYFFGAFGEPRTGGAGAPSAESVVRGAPPAASGPISAAVGPSAGASAVPSAAFAVCPPSAVVVPGGRFDMGFSGPFAESDGPAHVAYVDSYCLDRTEVTARAYAACVEAGRCPMPPSKDALCNYGRPDRADHPMNCVTHGEASAFCDAAGMRLPTEAEWELAVRGRGKDLPWGEGGPQGRAKLGDKLGTGPVGSFPTGATKDGVADLIGNVAEWVGDWFAPYGEEQVLNPRGPDSGTKRVVRGGAFTGVRAIGDGPSIPVERAGSHRDAAVPDTREPAIGFRCARSIK